jgi:hypothetical protein
MDNNRFQIKGLVRNRAKNEFQDGECQEIINLRFRDGAWRTVGEPTIIKDGAFTNVYRAIWLHVQDGVRNYIAQKNINYNLVLLDIDTDTETLIKAYSSAVEVKSLKRFIIVTGADTDIFIWADGVYGLINLDISPFVYLSAYDQLVQTTGNATLDPGSTSARFIGKYREKVYEMSQQGRIVGQFAYRFAWKMYDGSFVRHTIPQLDFLTMPVSYTVRRQNPPQNGPDWFVIIGVTGRKLRAKYPALDTYDSINKDLIQSLCIFMCKPEERYMIDEESIPYEMLQNGLPAGVNFKTFAQLSVPLNAEWDKMADSQSWHLVHEIDIESLQNLTEEFSEDIDLKGFMQDWATKQPLPVDSFSHHKLTGSLSYIYNDRLILADTKTQFGAVSIGDTSSAVILEGVIPAGYSLISTVPGLVQVTIKTSDGDKNVYSSGIFSVYGNGTNFIIPVLTKFISLDLFATNKIIGYQDARATKIDVWIDNGLGSYQKFGEGFKLVKSQYGNYSYFKNDNYSDIILSDVSISRADGDINNSTQLLSDENRVQVSELQNPFVFPARNSYQVGTGAIMALSANTEPLSTGQFGQFPLMVFTSKGVWALEQGQGDVLFASISPVSGDVILSKDQVVSVGSGVVFTTQRGLFLISGKQLVELSNNLEGLILTDFTANTAFQFYTNHSNLVQLSSNLSNDSAMEYILTSKIGFDKINSELIVTNYNYYYSYVYNFESNTWHKITKTYYLLVNDYPNLIAVNQFGMFSVSLESFGLPVDVLIVTQPQSFNALDVYKKIERCVMRCNVSTEEDRYLSFMVWASNDLKTWQLITGSQKSGDIKNLLIQRSHCSAQFYILAIFGNVKPESNITGFDISITGKLQNKLRK